MKTTVAMLFGSMVLSAVTGCTAQTVDENDMSTSANLTGGTEAAVWKPVPTKPNAEVVVHAEHRYEGALAEKCGPGYALDLMVDFSTATTETLGIDTVTAFYLPHAGNVVVPRRLGTWTKPGAGSDAAGVEGTSQGPGTHVRYEVKRAYRLDPGDPIVVLELESAGGRAPSDPACRQIARFVFYPVIPR